MKVDRNADLRAKGLHQFEGGVRSAQALHVLDGDYVSPHFYELLGHIYLVFQ